MPHRFYAPAAQAPGEIVLSDEEADHLRRVLRLRVDEEVRVFDGVGQEFAARVSAIDRSHVSVAVEARVEPAPEMFTRLTLAQSVIKGEKMDDVIRDAVMLGVKAIQPLVTARTDVPASAVKLRHERWMRIVLASTKQCGRAYLTEIHPARSFDDWIAMPPDPATIMLVEPAAARANVLHLRQALPRAAPGRASIAVGPEGGWAPEEIDRATAAGLVLATLGGRTLRADAVPLVALANLQFVWG